MISDIVLQEASTSLFFGATASGKTHLMREKMKPYRRVLWFDTTYDLDESDTSFEHVWGLKTIKDRLLTGTSDYRIVYHPTLSDIVTEFDLLTKLFWHLDFSRWLIVDEIHEFNDSETLRPAMKYGRKRLLGVLGASQRIYDVKPHVRTNARSSVLFYANEGRDLEAIRSTYGEQAMNAVKNLQPLIFDDVSKTVKQYPQCVWWKKGLPISIVDLAPKGGINESRIQPVNEASSNAGESEDSEGNEPDTGNVSE